MNLYTLTLANLRFHPLATFFNILLLAAGIAMILTLGSLERALSQNLTRELKGIDLVVSAKGSPLQIILSTVFQLDIPTGNIPLAEAQKLEKNRLIKKAFPLALGDSYNGFRIVGTTPAYPAHYGVALSNAGKFWTKEMEAVLGAEVARQSALKIGDTFVGSHGLTAGGENHDEFPYTVTGILKPSGSVIDRLVLTDIESVWHLHEHHHHDEDEHAAAPESRELTALLIQYASPLAAATLPRAINRQTGMQAASPAFETARLLKLTGTGLEIARAFGALLLGFAALSFFVALSSSLAERTPEIALLRALGATRKRVLSFVLLEGCLMGALGTLAGLALSVLMQLGVNAWIEASNHVALTLQGFGIYDAGVCVFAFILSALAAMIPALRAYRIDISDTLKRA
jgi:putative ABC transport system permease protein